MTLDVDRLIELANPLLAMVSTDYKYHQATTAYPEDRYLLELRAKEAVKNFEAALAEYVDQQVARAMSAAEQKDASL